MKDLQGTEKTKSTIKYVSAQHQIANIRMKGDPGYREPKPRRRAASAESVKPNQEDS